MFNRKKPLSDGARVLFNRVPTPSWLERFCIRELFANKIPDEQRICDLFQTTTSQSRSLIRSVLSKYQYELQEAVAESLKSLLLAQDPPDEGEIYEIPIHNESLVEEFNRRLAVGSPDLDSVKKKRGAVGTHVITRSAYFALREQLEIPLGDT